MKIQIMAGIPNEVVHTDYTQIHINGLGDLENAICTEILASEILDYVGEPPKFLEFILTKMRKNGKIIVSGTDLVEVARAIVNRHISLDEANHLLYNMRSASYSLSSINDLLESKGYKIVRRAANEYKYLVEGVRQ